jgi:curved DNA-binding protein CbpA
MLLQFKEISYAYEILSNPERRRIYDARGLDGLKDGGGEYCLNIHIYIVVKVDTVDSAMIYSHKCSAVPAVVDIHFRLYSVVVAVVEDDA